MTRAEQAATFCSALLGGPDGDDRLTGLYATVWTAGHKRTLWRRADQPGAVASLVADLDADQSTAAVYMCTTLHDQERNCDNLHDGQHRHEGHCKYRPHNTDSAGLLAAWLEIDIAGEGHSDSLYPPDFDAAMRVVAEMRLKPTMVVHSGGGIHVYWIFTEAWLVRDAADPTAERQRMAEFMRDWNYAAKYHAHRLGRWKIDATFDLARLLRPAGTTNRKLDDRPRKVEIIQLDLNATYEPDDLMDVLPDSSIMAAYGSPTGVSSVAVTEEQREVLTEVNLGAVYARVTSQAYRDADYTPEWLSDLLDLSTEVDPENLLLRTWNGERESGPKPFKNDQSTYDASLMRLLAGFPSIDTESLVEALMCRRLRAKASTDKIDPRKRMDYIARTVARFRLEAVKAAQLRETGDRRIEEAASARLSVDPPRPDVRLPADATPAQAEEAFLSYTGDLIDDAAPTNGEKRQVADLTIVTEHTGQDVPPLPQAEEENFFARKRPPIEIETLDMLTALLIPEPYRKRDVSVWSLEYRDNGEAQKGRVLLRLPTNFDWPTGNRPARYRPGRPFSTEWWRRDVFDGKGGFIKALQRDCLIIARNDGPAEEWMQCIQSLVPLWRRDSSGADLATFSREWLFQYLMLYHGTGQPEEVGSSGRPWVKQTNGWDPVTPPMIYIDVNEFLDHCRRQPGTVLGRSVKDVIEYLKLNKRRPRLGGSRRTWYEIDPNQFSAEEWREIIEVTRHSYDISASKRLRVVPGGKDLA